MSISGSRRARFHVYLEFAMAAMILVAIYNFLEFFYYQGYLPAPFFDDPGDTFMDWYNTVYWGYRHGTYNEWFSVYPPFAFLFMKFFSTPACYSESGVIGRDCDPLGAWVISAFAILNLVLVYLDYRKMDRSTAFPRAVAVGLGASALFGWERGNVIVCCFTFFILAHGRLLRSTWLRWICFGVTFNLKPYLVLVVLGRLLRRKWRWVEGCAISCILIYAASFMLLGRGSPVELISDMLLFSSGAEKVNIANLAYGTTYTPMLDALKSQLPLMFYLGSKPIEMVEHFVPMAIRLGELGVLVCYAGAVLYPTKLSSHRIAALTMVLMLSTIKTLGDYAEVFLLFLVFFEQWKRVGQMLAIVAAYLLCVPWDVVLVNIVRLETDGWLSGRNIAFSFGLTLGGLVRPGLILLIEYGLVAASLMDLSGFRWRRLELPVSAPSGGKEPDVRLAAN